jgi:SpoVK/Ycf46/Vps4 family AAA+-type ATPase
MNPPETYVGTSHLNPATLSRFKIAVEVPYPDSDLEFQIVKSKLPSSKKSSDEEIVETIRLAQDIRNGYAQQEYSYILSTRDLIAWHEVNEHYQNLVQSAQYTILGKCNQDDRRALESILKVYFSAPVEVRPEDGKVGQSYHKGNLFQVCEDGKLELYDKRNNDFLGYAKSGAVLEVIETKQGVPFCRVLKGKVQPIQPQSGSTVDPNEIPEPISLSHSDLVKVNALSSVSTRKLDSKITK